MVAVNSSTPVTQTKLASSSYTLCIGYPSIPEYVHLRSAAGLSPITSSQASHVASGSWYGCYISYSDPSNPTAPPTAVGMGRIISDGGWYFHIADMAVLPTHQRKGLGDAIMTELLAKISAETAAIEGKPSISLLADPPGRRLYAKHGFAASEEELGMILKTAK